jgi:hypothetical protein
MQRIRESAAQLPDGGASAEPERAPAAATSIDSMGFSVAAPLCGLSPKNPEGSASRHDTIASHSHHQRAGVTCAELHPTRSRVEDLSGPAQRRGHRFAWMTRAIERSSARLAMAATVGSAP